MTPLIGLAALVFVRIAGLFLALPVIDTNGVPKGVPVLLALATTALVLPNVDFPPAGTQVFFALPGEIVVGVLGGLVVRAVFSSLALAGELMGMQMGFAMAQLFDPVQVTRQNPVSVLSTLLASLLFLTLDLHVHVLVALVDGFHTIPPGTFEVLSLRPEPLIEAVGFVFRYGLQLAGPVMVFVLLINVLVGMLGKLAPRMNVFFSVGPTLTAVGGVALLAQALPSLLAAHAAMLQDALRTVRTLWGS